MKEAQHTVLVIFGASGDLTSRKLIPALFALHRKKRLTDAISIIGVSRKQYSDDDFRSHLRTAAGEAEGASEWEAFARNVFYQPGDIGNDSGFKALSEKICAVAGTDVFNCLFYLALAPELYAATIEHLGRAGFFTESEENGYRRVIIEKPFGRDFESCTVLNKDIQRYLAEHQIYHIDHYLGKETVQNVLIFRFGNAIFEPLWNRNYIDHVQITVAESVGVEHRAGYYDTSGVLRDMFQNHLLQLLTLVAMEPPALIEADSLRNEKVKVLRTLREIAPEHSARHTVRAQYEGYRSEPGVAPDSTTETYAALRIYIDNWRWQGVPFYLRSGKMLSEKATEIIIQFRRPPTQIFDTQTGSTELFTNRLSICIQPDEGIHLRFITKDPDGGMKTHPVAMAFQSPQAVAAESPDAYERLLLDALNGDASLFTRSDEIELAWKFIDSIRAGWMEDHAPGLTTYARGSWGPSEADDLLACEGHWWILGCMRQETNDLQTKEYTAGRE
ncbi:MAG TPA: glucose-6-phosphate dehydrogenase [Bacteroidota bacterium]|nr:glucose-6-phosphate dehydrogenase [Bacteroidota bacterium]